MSFATSRKLPITSLVLVFALTGAQAEDSPRTQAFRSIHDQIRANFPPMLSSAVKTQSTAIFLQRTIDTLATLGELYAITLTRRQELDRIAMGIDHREEDGIWKEAIQVRTRLSFAQDSERLSNTLVSDYDLIARRLKTYCDADDLQSLRSSILPFTLVRPAIEQMGNSSEPVPFHIDIRFDFGGDGPSPSTQTNGGIGQISSISGTVGLAVGAYFGGQSGSICAIAGPAAAAVCALGGFVAGELIGIPIDQGRLASDLHAQDDLLRETANTIDHAILEIQKNAVKHIESACVESMTAHEAEQSQSIEVARQAAQEMGKKARELTITLGERLIALRTEAQDQLARPVQFEEIDRSKLEEALRRDKDRREALEMRASEFEVKEILPVSRTPKNDIRAADRLWQDWMDGDAQYLSEVDFAFLTDAAPTGSTTAIPTFWRFVIQSVLRPEMSERIAALGRKP